MGRRRRATVTVSVWAVSARGPFCLRPFPPASRFGHTGSDGLIELDESCWSALAEYNLVLATGFGLLLLVVRQLDPAQASLVLLVENGALALLFGGMQTYCWISR